MASNSTNSSLRAHRLLYNVKSEDYFATSICGIIVIFTLLHWTRRLGSCLHRLPSVVSWPFAVVSRCLRNALVRPVPGFDSLGHGLLVALYMVINLVLVLTHVDESSAAPEASRFGWILMANLCLVVFLALKNSPLACLTAYSYESLSGLHQIAGCTTLLLTILHAVAYTVALAQRHHTRVLRQGRQVAGIVAAFLFLLMVATALFLRRRAYRVFYTLHLVAFAASIVGIAFHRPDFVTRIPIITCLTAALFVADRLLRLIRFVLNCTNNTATVYPLPNGGTRVFLAKKPARTIPGKHLRLWIPHLQLWGAHPLTVVSTSPVEFVVQSHSHFTRRLHAYASANPGGQLWAAAEGPYGCVPDPLAYDRVVLIAGGSGGSYAFALARSMLERMDATSSKSIVLVWAVKTQENLAWFDQHLNTLCTHRNIHRVRVSLHVTQPPGSSSSEDSHHTRGARAVTEWGDEKVVLEEKEEEEQMMTRPGEKPLPATPAAAADLRAPLPIRYRDLVSFGRPDVTMVVREAAASMARSQRVLVAACGPPVMLKAVRNAATKNIRNNRAGVDLHCEQFGR